MAFEQRPGSASLFQNRKKEKPNQPDFKGTGVLQVENKLVTIEFAAWTKFSEKAGDWYSLSMKTTEVKDNPDMDKAFLEEDSEIQH